MEAGTEASYERPHLHCACLNCEFIGLSGGGGRGGEGKERGGEGEGKGRGLSAICVDSLNDAFHFI